MMGVELRVVDLMDRELPPGEVGEVVARGDNIMKGYWNQPAITADTLRGGCLHTGDMGRSMRAAICTFSTARRT